MTATRGRGRPRRLPAVPCPNPLHAGSRVASEGTRRTGAGTQRRFRCRPVGRPSHTFSMLVETDGRMRPLWSSPPPCLNPEHQNSRVSRYGTYGKRTDKPRQRYRCVYGQDDDGNELWHTFTPPLPREHVHAASGACAKCEELRGVHHGDAAVARRHAWSARVVARGLDQLSTGASYADVSRWALRVAGGGARGRSNRPKDPQRTRPLRFARAAFTEAPTSKDAGHSGSRSQV